jgi:hypothetical protein
MDRHHHGVGLRGQEAIDLMRPRDRLGLGAMVAVERGPDASEREQRPVLAQREPNHVLFLPLRVRLRCVLGEAVGRDEAAVLTAAKIPFQTRYGNALISHGLAVTDAPAAGSPGGLLCRGSESLYEAGWAEPLVRIDP